MDEVNFKYMKLLRVFFDRTERTLRRVLWWENESSTLMIILTLMIMLMVTLMVTLMLMMMIMLMVTLMVTLMLMI